jgi:predicted small lipoprotein YifL
MRRRILAAVAVAGLMTMAGCGVLLGNEPLEFAAAQATVSDSALEETGYEETNVTEQVVEREFEAAGQTREVSVTNHLAQYERQVGIDGLGEQRAAAFVAFSSPQIELPTGDTLNPIGDMSEKDILTNFDTGYEGISVGEQTGSRNVTALDGEREIKQFDGTATLAGQEVDVVVHAGKFKHGSDFVAVVAIYPERIDSEDEDVVTMIEGLEHESES